MENERTESQKRFLAFCVNFPQDLPTEIKHTFNQLLNSSLTSIDRMPTIAIANEWPVISEGKVFSFKEKTGSTDIYNTLRYVLEQYQNGKNPSIAHGVAHYGFDLVFVELVKDSESMYITDSYLIQNAFIQRIESVDGFTELWLKGFYAQNLAVAELAKTLIEQTIQSAKDSQTSETTPSA